MARTLPVVQPGDPSLTPGTSIDVVDEWVGAVGRATAPHGSRVHPGGHGRVTFPEGYDQAAIDQLLLEVTMSPASRWDVLVMASDAPPGGHHILLVHGRSRGLDVSVMIEPDGRGILDGWPTIPRAWCPRAPG
ncbi:hypothetical protein [Arsenicicoccus piscis]|uniref:Uncharacterized protein n=1 Tax=Arsenicicoccus piscis TaxID=673954 RepID=A0ABQ6HKB9_9MICO|nr:hypothetical protein [Arsenicicoccus piscis]GMA18909.1 hypothetical protein GCM10025862_09300 [Arsenicicoccus piscis]